MSKHLDVDRTPKKRPLVKNIIIQPLVNFFVGEKYLFLDTLSSTIVKFFSDVDGLQRV